MKRLPFYVVLLPGLFLGIQPVGAQQLAQLPQPLAEQRVEQTALLAQPEVWVVKGKQLERKPFIWVFKSTRTAQSPFLQVLNGQLIGNAPAATRLGKLKDTNKPDVADDQSSQDSPLSQLGVFSSVVKNTSASKGLFTLYRNKQTGKIYLEIKPHQLNKNYLGTATMESGIGERGIYSGMPLQTFLFYFRRVNNNLHFVVRNVNFRTAPGDPQVRSLNRSFSDSVLYSLPIKSIHPQSRSILIDLGDLLLSDLSGLTSELSSLLKATYQLDDKKSYFGSAKAFPLNMEIESVYGFSADADAKETPYLPTLPDSRALTLRVRYSLSQLPENDNYRPRLADDRIGYFITAYQDFSSDNRTDPFIRYINRWNLEKQNPNAPISPPKKPIIFWIENAVPVEYRDAIKEGVLMWNKAFEKAGFKNAIEVRQMPNNATWDPADVRYNTIRWINTVDGFFALGPSRVNPLNGKILDADIVVDGSFVRSLKQEYRTRIQPNQRATKSSLSQLFNGLNFCHSATSTFKQQLESPDSDTLAGSEVAAQKAAYTSNLFRLATERDLCYGMQAVNQLAMGSMALSLFHNATPNSDQMKTYIYQSLRLIIAHEVGHTLGLRHNFRGSTLLKPEEMNNTNITQMRGLTSSVMDYIPPNIAPQGVQQGDFFPSVVGPYDHWAVQYGYTPTPAMHPLAERRFLEKIARLSVKPELAYATDEDTVDLDPNVNAWDNSGDVLRYSQWQLDNGRRLWHLINKRYPIQGESYSQISKLFDTVFFHYLQNTYFITKYIGGQSFHRDHAGEPNGQLPFEPVPVEKQRQALAMLQKYIFAEDAFNFPPELLNKLAPSRWRDWGNAVAVDRLDYPIHDSVYSLQSLVLKELLSGDRLNRLRDIELKSQPGQALTLPELFNTLQTGIWTEVLQPGDKPLNISSFRRALQREYLNVMTRMVLRTGYVPEDARTLAWYKLRQLRDKLNKRFSDSSKLDEYTKAHLEETRDRVNKALNAQVQSK